MATMTAGQLSNVLRAMDPDTPLVIWEAWEVGDYPHHVEKVELDTKNGWLEIKVGAVVPKFDPRR